MLNFIPKFCKGFLLLFLFLFIEILPQNEKVDRYSQIIYDSSLSLKEALAGIDIPGRIKENLIIIDVQYFSFDGKLHQGQIVIHKYLAKDLIEIFEIIKREKFPVGKAIPIVNYNWSDEASMKDNNTSGFNYRKVKGTNVLSSHSEGKAIDINPLLNPQIKNKKVNPVNAEYNISNPGTLTKNSLIVKEFINRGWAWGGNWTSLKDYQHFEKQK